jgi:hypothetical protein
MAYGTYVYTDDAGTAYTVSVPTDIATALSMVAATGQPYLDDTIQPRFANFRDGSGNVRQGVIQSKTVFASVLGSVIVIGGVNFTGSSAKGESIGALQPNLIQPPQALMGPPGASGISALTNNHIFVGSASNLPADVAMSGDATIVASGAVTVANQAITNAKLANMAADTVKGNGTAGSAAPTDLSQTQLTALINAVTSSLSGAAPASGGGTTNFLRADATWAVPPGSAVITVPTAGTITVGSNNGINHGLGHVPKLFAPYLVCVTAERGYATGDIATLQGPTSTPTFGADATKIYMSVPSGSTLYVCNKDASTYGAITPANWKWTAAVS